MDRLPVAAFELFGPQRDLALEHGLLPRKLVLEALHSQQVLQADLELQAIDRPGKKVIRPLGQPFDPGFLVLQRRHDDDGQRPRALLGAEPAGHLEAVHAWHHHVEDDEIHRPLGGDRQGLLAIGGHQGLVPLRLHDQHHQLACQRLIVDDQDTRLAWDGS